MNRLREFYFAAWAICFSVASFLLIPSVQGTTPANLFALASLGFAPFLRREKFRQYVQALLIFAGCWIALVGLGQAGLHFFHSPPLPRVLAVDPDDFSVLFRKSIITQTAYLVAGFLTCLFFALCYRPEWRRYLFWGAWVLAIYGIYEWLYFLIMKQPGDFIANRSFLGGAHPGSWSQIIHVGKFELLRIKSTTGEPSFLALAGVPYLILAISSRKWALVAALSFCLFLSFSTTFYLSAFLVAGFSIFYFRAWKGRYLAVIAGLAVVGIALVIIFPEFIDSVFAKKLSGEGPSGNIRSHVYLEAMAYWTRLSFVNKIVGIGFGSAFVTPWLGGILINAGLIGVALYFLGFGWPVFKLPNTPENWEIKAMLLALVFMLSVSVADFTYLTTWMALGLAYGRLREVNPPSGSPSSSSGRKRRRSSRQVETPAIPIIPAIDRPASDTP